MSIRRLIFGNYRSFREEHEIELAPVTIVLGKNNSGKSALVRVPLVVASGFNNSSPAPLDMARFGVGGVGTTRDLYFDQHTLRRLLRLGISVDGSRPFTMRADLQYVDELGDAVVVSLRIDHPRGDPEQAETVELISTRLLSENRRPAPALDGTLKGPTRHVSPREPEEYEIRATGLPPRVARVPFSGLLPAPGTLAGLQELFELDPGPISYLGPYRKPVFQQCRRTTETPVGLGNQHGGSPATSDPEKDLPDAQLLDLVNDKLTKVVPGWRISGVRRGPLWSPILIRDGSRSQLNLADAGSGLNQVLPILIKCASDELAGAGRMASLQIVEAPEAHLHPAAHAELADLYLAVARETGTRLLVETHSETLLLRLRRRVAEGANGISPEDIAIYVVEQSDGVSCVRRVGLDSLGNLDDAWPHGYFSQDYHEVRELARAQLEKVGDAP
ncbi:AAA family ATPase [Solwaraspora sp. WMMD1047]|uniref:AAA family ATPase n=1 Tax=Solwaraspora sp. WMMD1047 TaxID=3016102 RepID=UPI0024163F24|nr:AAA family ATPase [Solwaraspora sp. WMMD1047]MDG4828136.1 AAA family ATPase [Solwaraspora sp. WMMD1047]